MATKAYVYDTADAESAAQQRETDADRQADMQWQEAYNESEPDTPEEWREWARSKGYLHD